MTCVSSLVLYVIFPFAATRTIAIYNMIYIYIYIHEGINIQRRLSLVFCNVSIDISDKRNVESFERIRRISWDFMPVRQAIFPLLCATLVFHEHCERKCVLAEFQRFPSQLRPVSHFIIICITSTARCFLNRFSRSRSLRCREFNCLQILFTRVREYGRFYLKKENLITT